MKPALLLLLLVPSTACVPDDAFVLPELAAQGCAGDPPAALRVVSYNIKSGALTSLEQVGDALAELSPDVLALQEVDVDFKGEDQAAALAARLGHRYVYAAALSRAPGRTFGNALTTRLPVRRAERLSLRAFGAAEPRVAIDATLCLGPAELRLLATHADVWRPSPALEALGERLEPTVRSPTIVLGDFNVQPHEGPAERLAAHGLTDLIEGATFWPHGKHLDYLMVDASLRARVIGAGVGASKASDHHPVWADFSWGPVKE